MPALLKLDNCFCLDDKGSTIFSVVAFIRLNGLSDDPRLRIVIIEEIREIFPNIRILEEAN
jgi:hypothetical protein